MQIDKDILEKAKEWSNNLYFDADSREEIHNLLVQDNQKELIERFHKDLEFGTGGLRSIIGMGSNRINKYTVRKATQALAQVIQQSFPLSPQLPFHKVAVSYDSRLYSQEFAHEVCAVLAANNIKAYIYPYLNPVPLLSFAVREMKAQAGVMITASHNPIQYNGLKAFWNDGCQVIPPIDQKIINAYNGMTHFDDIKFMDFTEGLRAGKIEYIGEEIENAYFQNILHQSLQPQLCRTEGEKLKIIYTPLHGTGGKPCSRALTQLGLTNFHLVKEQATPDARFSTLTTPPNPEIPQALMMATQLLKKEKADIAFGTDPDTDRLGVVVSHQSELHYLSGNQLAVLLLHYILSQMQLQNKLKANPLIIKTIVTTELMTILAHHFNCHIENTLTGFKWMCGRLRELEEQYEQKNDGTPPYQFIFASEESFGYLTHGYVRDKDAVAALAMTAEMALHYKVKNKTLIDALDDIYDQYGFSYESLLSFDYEGKEGAEKIQRIMHAFRHLKTKEICGEEIVIKEDYLCQQKINLFTGETTAMTIPQSDVIGLHFKSGNKIYLRPSGTEPKIKFYLMIQEKSGTLKEKKQKTKSHIAKLEQYITDFCGEI